MYRDVDTAFEHRFFDFLGEQTLVADLFQRTVRIDQRAVVARGLDDHDVERLKRQVERLGQAFAGFISLSQCKRRSAGADVQGLVGCGQVNRHESIFMRVNLS